MTGYRRVMGIASRLKLQGNVSGSYRGGLTHWSLSRALAEQSSAWQCSWWAWPSATGRLARDTASRCVHRRADSWDVTSTLIYGKSEAILVDCQFRISQAKKLADQVAARGRRLKAIIVTHPDNDHYIGTAALPTENSPPSGRRRACPVPLKMASSCENLFSLEAQVTVRPSGVLITIPICPVLRWTWIKSPGAGVRSVRISAR